MKKFKFRAKRCDDGEWAYGSAVIFCDDYCFIDKDDELYIQRPYTFRGNTHFIELSAIKCETSSVCQFTGLRDKNSKEIYEGDVIRSFDSNHNEIIHHIEWRDDISRFVATLKASNEFAMHISSAISQEWIDEFEKEVVGDIYNNTKLLNK